MYPEGELLGHVRGGEGGRALFTTKPVEFPNICCECKILLPQLVRQHIRNGALERSGIKAIYVAPMKALAQEVVAKFSQRLKPLGLVRRVGLRGPQQMVGMWPRLCLTVVDMISLPVQCPSCSAGAAMFLTRVCGGGGVSGSNGLRSTRTLSVLFDAMEL